MSDALAVIIPTLNEQECIEASIASAWSSGASEVIVSDGGSTDQTLQIAQNARASILTTGRSRAEQLNVGAIAARSDTLLFLHADTRLPADAAEVVADALRSHHFGGFSLRFLESDWRLRVVETMINLRTRFTRCPWGDQAQFIKRNVFLEHEGYALMPIMEDYEFAIRMRRKATSTVLPQEVQTSGRRFLDRGVLRTAAMNWRLITAYRLGADPHRLAELYRKKPRS